MAEPKRSRVRSWIDGQFHSRSGLVVLALLCGTAAISLWISRSYNGLLSTLVAILIPLPALYLAWLAIKPRSESTLADIADQLAEAMVAYWRKEAGFRRLNEPYPLPVSWIAADSSLTVAWDVLVRQASSGAGWPSPASGTWAAGPNELSGKDRGLADVLARVPTGRLVVLGAPGAGKTMLMVRLVLDLLARRLPGGPVPMLMSLASWNLRDQDLHSWLADQLCIEHPGLAAAVPPGAGEGSQIKALLRDNLILPILDGMDEIPDAIRGEAIAEINNILEPGEPLVLTCRTESYQKVVEPQQGPGAILRAATVVLCPLEAADVSKYLRDDATGPLAVTRWSAVITVLGTDAPAGQALTTPLMVGLARAIYNPRPGEQAANLPDPAELCSPDLADRDAVANHLFDAFIPAAYRHLPGVRTPWKAQEANRWLAFLARQQEDQGTANIEWWNLSKAAPVHMASLAVSFVLAVVGAVGYPFAGLGVGVISGLLVGLIVRRWTRTGKASLTRGLAGGFFGGAIGASTALAFLGPEVQPYEIGSVIASGLAIGIAVASMSRLIPSFAGGLAGGMGVAFYERARGLEPLRTAIGPGSHLINGVGCGAAVLCFIELAGRKIPARKLRWSPAWFACTGCSSVFLSIVVWVQVSWAAGLGVAFAGALIGGTGQALAADSTKDANPRAVLRRDRITFTVSCLGFGLGLGVGLGVASGFSSNAAGTPNGLRYGLAVGITNLIVTGITFGFIQAVWGRFTVARWWLAASGQLPWRIMTFLHDAHAKRGVLRQVGAAYQFRHIELQRHLSTEPEIPVMKSEPASSSGSRWKTSGMVSLLAWYKARRTG
jgi:NACHT domain